VTRRPCVWGVGGAAGAPANQQGWSVCFGLAQDGCQLLQHPMSKPSSGVGRLSKFDMSRGARPRTGRSFFLCSHGLGTLYQVGLQP